MLDGRLIGLFLELMLSNTERAAGGTLARRFPVLEMVPDVYNGSCFAVPPIEGPFLRS